MPTDVETKLIIYENATLYTCIFYNPKKLLNSSFSRPTSKPRREIVIATKVRFTASNKPNDGGLGRRYILQACDASLKRLDTEYIDLYQVK